MAFDRGRDTKLRPAIEERCDLQSSRTGGTCTELSDGAGQLELRRENRRGSLPAPGSLEAGDQRRQRGLELGREHVIAQAGAEALQVAQAMRPDLLLLDLGLPKIDGYEVARAIRAQAWGEAMVLVAVTGWGQDEDRRKSSEAGFNAHLVKPVAPLALMALIEDTLGAVQTG